MRRPITWLAILLLLAGISIFFYFANNDLVIRVSEKELRTKINEFMPLKKTYFLIFETELANPRVKLRDGSERIHLGMDVGVTIELFGLAKSFRGKADLSGGIRYEPDGGNFFLVNPYVEKLEIDDVPDERANKANEAISSALTAYFNTYPVYTLKGKDTRHAAADLFLKKVIVEGRHLVIYLGL